MAGHGMAGFGSVWYGLVWHGLFHYLSCPLDTYADNKIHTINQQEVNMFIEIDSIVLFSTNDTITGKNHYCSDCWGDNEITDDVSLYTIDDLEKLDKIARCDECNTVIFRP